jgi:hypothetical protein
MGRPRGRTHGYVPMTRRGRAALTVMAGTGPTMTAES